MGHGKDTQRLIGALQVVGGALELVYGGGVGLGGGGGYLIGSGIDNLGGNIHGSAAAGHRNRGFLADLQGSFTGHGPSSEGNWGGALGGLIGGRAGSALGVGGGSGGGFGGDGGGLGGLGRLLGGGGQQQQSQPSAALGIPQTRIDAAQPLSFETPPVGSMARTPFTDVYGSRYNAPTTGTISPLEQQNLAMILRSL